MRILNRQEFLETSAGVHAKRELQHMVTSSSYDTGGSQDPLVGLTLTFVERHLNYLMRHPYVSTEAYLSNLRIMTKVKR